MNARAAVGPVGLFLEGTAAMIDDEIREWIEECKAKRRAKLEAEAEKKKLRKEEKQRRKEERERRKQEQYSEARKQAVAATEEVVESRKAKREARQALVARFGRIGSRIEGSNLFRDYCISCGQPIRVVDAGKPNTCLDCKPDGVPGARSGNVTSGEINYHGGRFNSAEW